MLFPPLKSYFTMHVGVTTPTAAEFRGSQCDASVGPFLFISLILLPSLALLFYSKVLKWFVSKNINPHLS